MTGSAYRQDTGRRGEDLASSFFISNGFEIIEKNFRFKRMGEIDLIVRKENLVLFVEVKNRTTDRYGGAHFSINKKKQNTIRKVAQIFLDSNPNYYAREISYRFDLISVKDGEIEWVQDIIR